MSDLLAPVYVVMCGEITAFWAFVGFMNRVVHKCFTTNKLHVYTTQFFFILLIGQTYIDREGSF